MNLDVRTIYIAMAATCFIVAISLFIFQAGRFRRDGNLSWAVGWAFHGAFWTLLGLRGVIWDFASIVVAHTFLAASFSFLYAAVREFQSRRYNRGLLFFPPVATFVFFWYFSTYADELSYRIIFISLLSILQTSAIAWALFRNAPVHQRRSYWLTGFAFFVFALVFLNRLIEVLTLPQEQLPILVATAFRNASVLMGFGVAIFSSIGFVLMIRELAEQRVRESEINYSALYSSMVEGVAQHEIIYDTTGQATDYIILDANPAFETITGLGRAKIVGKKASEIYGTGEAPYLDIYARVASSGRAETFETYFPPMKKHFDITVFSSGKGRFATVFQDITERKQMEVAIRRQNAVLRSINRIFEKALTSQTEEDLAKVCLTVAEEVTESRFGFIGEIGQDGLLHDIAISDPGWERCTMGDKTGHRRPPGDFKIHGLYGRVLQDGKSLFSNAPGEHPDSIGTPAGHPRLDAFLGVPLIRDGQIIGMIALGNREGGYGQEEMDALETLAPVIVESFAYRRSEEALREAHGRALWLARFPDENPNPIVRVSAKGTVLYCNTSAVKLPGWTCAVGQPLDDRLLPLVSRAMAEGKEAQEDVEIGSRFYSAWVTPFLGEGYANIYGRDITVRKKAEEALVRSKEEWEWTFKSIPDMIAILNDRNRIVRVNPAMAERLGRKPDQCVGLACYEAVHGMDCPPAFCPHTRTMADGRGHTVEVHEAHLGGDFLVSTNPIFDEQGRMIGTVHVARDITELKRVEEELRRSRDGLEIRVQERTTELAKTNEVLRESESRLKYLSAQLLLAQEQERRRIAHDLHDSLASDLAAIKSSLERKLISMKGGPASQPIKIEEIITNVQRTIEETRRIMNNLHPSILDDLGVLVTIRWFCRDFQSINSGFNIEQHLAIEEDEIPVLLKAAIFRVTQEAMNNAAKHSQANSIRVSVIKDDGSIRLVIADNGQGFDWEEKNSVKSEQKGLGLASMKERVELSGGVFTIVSRPGGGTEIQARWPQISESV